MSDVSSLLARFVDDWHAGRRPLVEEALAATSGEKERHELASMLATFLEHAPTPAYDEQALEDLMHQPAVAAAAETLTGARMSWPARVGERRRRLGLSLNSLARTVLAEAGVKGDEERAARYLNELERGTRDATEFSPRLIEVLGRSLKLRPEVLSPAPASGALYRKDQSVSPGTELRLEAFADALASPPPSDGERPRDPVDELFFG